MTDTKEKVEDKAEVKEEVKPNSLLRTVDIAVNKKEMETLAAKELRARAKTAKFHGFRPGKAPASMVEAAFGSEVRLQALNDLAIKQYVEKLKEGKFEPVGDPDFTPADPSEDADNLYFKASFEVMPEVKVPDLKDVEVTEYACKVDDSDVQKTLDIMRKQRATFEKVDRAAADNDGVNIDFEGKLDGTPFAGGAAKGYFFVLGAGRMLPEFEAAIKGMKAGETKVFPLTFPTEYHAKDLAGKEVQFEVKVNEVEKQVEPELDDKFAESLGITEGGIEKLKADIRDNLDREVKARVQARTKQSVMNALVGVAKFDIPHAMVESQRMNLVNQTLETIKARGGKIDASKVPANAMLAEAEQRVRLGLLVEAIIRDEKITTTPEQIKALATDISKSYEDPEEVVNWYLNNQQRKAELTAVVTENNVVDWVLKNAKVKKEDIAFETLMGQN